MPGKVKRHMSKVCEVTLRSWSVTPCNRRRFSVLVHRTRGLVIREKG